MKATNEEKEIIQCIIMGKNNSEIAEEIGYSLGAVKKKINNIYKKFNVNSRVGLVREYFIKVLKEIR